MKNKEIILSAIYIPYFKDLYFAKKDNGAFKNGKKIRCSSRKNIKHTENMGIFTGKFKTNKVKRLIDQENLHLWFSDLGFMTSCAMYTA